MRVVQILAVVARGVLLHSVYYLQYRPRSALGPPYHGMNGVFAVCRRIEYVLHDTPSGQLYNYTDYNTAIRLLQAYTRVIYPLL